MIDNEVRFVIKREVCHFRITTREVKFRLGKNIFSNK